MVLVLVVLLLFEEWAYKNPIPCLVPLYIYVGLYNTMIYLPLYYLDRHNYWDMRKFYC